MREVLIEEPVLIVHEPERRRRGTVAARLILAIPVLLIALLAMLVAELVTIVAWFAALFLGRVPDKLAAASGGCLRYVTWVSSYVLLLTDEWPNPNMDEGYPVDLVLHPGRLNRWAVGFRLILMIPAHLVLFFAQAAAMVMAVCSWFAIVFTGRTSPALYRATAAIVRYVARYYAFAMMLTSVYPSRLFGDPAPVADEVAAPADALPVPPAADAEIPSAADERASEGSSREPMPIVLPRRGKAWIIWGGIAGFVLAMLPAAFLPPHPAFVALDDRYIAHIDRVDADLGRLDRCISLGCSTAAAGSLRDEVRDFVADLGGMEIPEELASMVADVRRTGTALEGALTALADAGTESVFEGALQERPLEPLGLAFATAVEDLLDELSYY